MTVTLVTGSTGFVGASLVAELRRRGVPVRALTRTRSSFATDDGGIDARVTGDLTQHPDLNSLVAGVDTVMHLAARAHVTTDRSQANHEQYRLANEVLTRRLAEAAVHNGVRRFVFVSSIKVFGETDPGRPLQVDDSPQPMDAYGQSKWRAEQTLRTVCDGTQTAAVVVRPPLVYGPGVRANFLRLMQLVRSGIPLPLANVNNRRSLVSVDNLVDLLCVCRELPATAGTWHVSDGEDLSTPQLLTKVAQAMGRPVRLFGMPLPLLLGLARPLGYAAEISRLTDSLSLDIGKTRSALGWRPAQSADEGIAKAVHYYLRSGT